jgi:UPF0716 protein FxsA
MRPLPALFVALVVVPFLEMALLIAVASRIGFLPAVALVIATALLGSVLVSRQGRGQIQRVQQTLAAGAFPATELAHGAMILVAGALLITPGFITDAIGFSLLVPGVREAIRRYGTRRMQNRVQIL